MFQSKNPTKNRFSCLFGDRHEITRRKGFKKYLSIWLFLIAKNWSLSLPATYHCSLPQMNLMLTIVFGVVGLVLSYGFFIPPELPMFRLIAAVGVMVGYQAGQLVGRLVRPRPKRFLTLSVSALFCFYFAFAYVQTPQMGSANTSDIVNLGVLLGLSFFWLGFLLPFTRVPNEIKILWSRAIEHFARLFRD